MTLPPEYYFDTSDRQTIERRIESIDRSIKRKEHTIKTEIPVSIKQFRHWLDLLSDLYEQRANMVRLLSNSEDRQ